MEIKTMLEKAAVALLGDSRIRRIVIVATDKDGKDHTGEVEIKE
jgi:hypothetical protein